LQAQLAQLSAQLEQRPGDESLLTRLGRIEERFTALGGHRWEHDVERLLLGLSFRRAEFDKPLGELSGGQRQKACLARALLSEGNCFIFDEPTNHLDLAAQAFFVDYLKELPGEHAVLLVSHDRWLLDALATHIWELDGGELFRYPGNYSKYAPLRDLRRAQARQAFERQAEHIARTGIHPPQHRGNTRRARGRHKLLSQNAGRPADDPQMSFILQPAPQRRAALIVEKLCLPTAYGQQRFRRRCAVGHPPGTASRRRPCRHTSAGPSG
jgi:ATP-binding cassette subfamily F protein 3